MRQPWQRGVLVAVIVVCDGCHGGNSRDDALPRIYPLALI